MSINRTVSSLPLLPALLLLVGCGDPATFQGVAIGDDRGRVLSARPGLSELTDFDLGSDLFPEDAKEAGKILGYSRKADPEADPPERVSRETYYFREGKLILAVVVFGQDVDYGQLESQARAANGNPTDEVGAMGVSVHSWERVGSQLRLIGSGGATRLALPGGSEMVSGGSSIVVLMATGGKDWVARLLVLMIVLLNGGAIVAAVVTGKRMRRFLATHHEIAGEGDLADYRRLEASNKLGTMVFAGSLLVAFGCALYGLFLDHTGIGGILLWAVLSAVATSVGKGLKSDETRLRQLPGVTPTPYGS